MKLSSENFGMGKRPNPNLIGAEVTPVKRRKGRPPTASIEDFTSPSVTHSSSSIWHARPLAHLDLKMSSIYNRSAPEAPAELFR